MAKKINDNYIKKYGSWYDKYLKSDERHGQVSSLAARARPRMQEEKKGEAKFIPSYASDAKEQAAERTALRRQTARNMKEGYGSTGSAYGDKMRSNRTRERIKSEFNKKGK